MIFNKIWERHILREVAKGFGLLIICFYALYVLIDYSSRAGTFRHLGLTFSELAFYYLYTFIQRLDILVPFALLIASIRTLINLNVHNEIIALMASGIPMRKILRPLVVIGLFFTLLVYLNTEFILPAATKGLKKIQDAHFFNEKDEDDTGAQSLLLKNGTPLIFQSFDSNQGLFFDVYWIHTADDIYRMKYLIINEEEPETPPMGKFVDHLVRDSVGRLLRFESFESKVFSEIEFSQQNLAETLVPAHDQAMTKLWSQLPGQDEQMSDKHAKVLTAFYRKLAMPWLCLLAIIAPAPFCLAITRNLPVFFIYVCSMFGLVALYLLLNAAMIMGQSQVMPPAMAIWPLVFCVGGYFGVKFIKLC